MDRINTYFMIGDFKQCTWLALNQCHGNRHTMNGYLAEQLEEVYSFQLLILSSILQEPFVVRDEIVPTPKYKCIDHLLPEYLHQKGCSKSQNAFLVSRIHH